MSPFRDRKLPFIIYKQKTSHTIYYKFLDIHVLNQKPDLKHQYIVKYIIKDHRLNHIWILETKVYMLKSLLCLEGLYLISKLLKD